ncbi:hypothetical protein DICPUDRAFT_88764 [Dictyostelium purpureum]|uniref:LysM domain-containing protein n=1 Tax=Dictyostelium purpureum TaxID=5786 RepID=F0ZRH1_DICPU|nr:uncharacterized protein DICPUDRAFT_88764 [Dictyostelium purpureum]EGC33441.1 hypothetical protein DICPUDRAFT_88764 [Dictyostelium purpureum]|eukprot:XP_003290012.1 hypothetical protein DICPUDRAFT_88764 [Dictyostelium purpureum]
MIKIIIFSFLVLGSLAICKAFPSGSISGVASYYNDAGIGACGTQINAKTDLIVAIPTSYWTSANPNADPLCNTKIKVTHGSNSVVLTVVDKCPTCGPNKIDISESAFILLAGSTVDGIINVTWEFIGTGSSSTTTGNSGSVTSGASTTGGGSCQKQVAVASGQGCWDVWTSKCGNLWDENQFYQSNPGVQCTSLKVGQLLCCGKSSASSGTTGSSSSGSCSRKTTVDAGQGCWDVWTSKCGNLWNENQFYQANPGVQCTSLKINQSLCCN